MSERKKTNLLSGGLKEKPGEMIAGCGEGEPYEDLLGG